MADLGVALVGLAERVRALEEDASFRSEPADRRPTSHVGAGVPVLLTEALRELKLLRSRLVSSSTRQEMIAAELRAIEVENLKLKYQVSHLKRALQQIEK